MFRPPLFRILFSFVRLAAALLPAAGAFAADTGRPLSAAEFEALSVGRTFFYEADGVPYGAEQYLPGRKVVWAFVGDDCRKGSWYEDAGYICFVYEDSAEPQCWTFEASPTGLMARFRDDPGGAPLVGVRQSPAPLACLGPDVGV
ncbi:MAG: hypothetical protein ACKVPY_13675 [Paracoccaceae bacterium]